MAKAHALFEPNKSRVGPLSSSTTLVIKVQLPKTLSGVTIEILELDTWRDERGRRQSAGKKNKDDLLASFQGEIKERKFSCSSANIPKLSHSDNLFSPPAVPIAFEGSEDTRYKLALDTGAIEDEGSNWELGLRIKQGSKVLYVTEHATLIGGASLAYLWNRGSGSDRADIFEGSKPYPGYIAHLKHHLSVLGFYRRENESGCPKKRYKPFRKGNRNLVTFNYTHLDRWDDELKRAIQTFHLAAIQPVRNDVATGGSINIDTSSILPKGDPGVSTEINDVRVGDKTKEEILKWLGSAYDEDAEIPRWRSPYICSFAYAYDQFHKTKYLSVLNGHNIQSGRIVAHPDLNKRQFVCTTGVNWFMSHLLSRNTVYDYSANAPVIHAVLGGKIFQGTTKTLITATPLYYKDFFRIVHMLPWMHELDSDRASWTLQMLKLIADPIWAPDHRIRFPVCRELARIDVDRKTLWVRYNIPVDSRSGVRFHLLPVNPLSWAPIIWSPIVEGFAYSAGKRLMSITLGQTVPDGQLVLVTYEANDAPCRLPRGTHAWNEAGLSCRCGLHKSYAEIEATKALLGTWNIASMHNGTKTDSAIFNHSTLIIHKHNGTLYVLHADGGHYFRTFAAEAEKWNRSGRGVDYRGVYYTVFKADDAEIAKLNPCFAWDPEASISAKENKLSYIPIPETHSW